MKPIYLYILTLVAFLLSLLFFDLRSLMNEIYTLFLCIGLFNQKKLNPINTISVYGLVAVNMVNVGSQLMGVNMIIGQGFEWYCIAYAVVYSSFLGIIFFLRFNEIFD